MKHLILYGSASGKILKTFDLTIDLIDDTTLLEFLRSHRIPVASSCLGDGVCKKCVVTINDEKILACMMSLKVLFTDRDTETLSFSYL